MFNTLTLSFKEEEIEKAYIKSRLNSHIHFLKLYYGLSGISFLYSFISIAISSFTLSPNQVISDAIRTSLYVIVDLLAKKLSIVKQRVGTCCLFIFYLFLTEGYVWQGGTQQMILLRY